jgi:ABC-2 type transport system permease protein
MNAHAHAQASERRIGPSALGDDFRRFVNLTLTLAVTDFKLRYFGSFLGYLWSLMRPLLFFGVLYVVFTQVVRLGEEVPYYPVYLLQSIVIWTYFAETTTTSVRSLVDRENLLRKIRFPRLVIPLSVSLTAMFNLGLNLIAVVIFALLSGIKPTVGWLEVPILVLVITTFATGVSMFLSALFVRFRDLLPIWDVSLQVLFYGSPILFVAAKYPDSVERILMCNPIAVVLTQMRKAVIQPSAPSAAEMIGGQVRLLIPFAIILAVFALGYWVFSREAPRIAENL